jgi:hypothetical protein
MRARHGLNRRIAPGMPLHAAALERAPSRRSPVASRDQVDALRPTPSRLRRLGEPIRYHFAQQGMERDATSLGTTLKLEPRLVGKPNGPW